MYQLKNVNKKYKNSKVLKNISCEFDVGVNFIVGPSGSGKTSLLKILSGLEEDYTGEITINDQNFRQIKAQEMRNLYNDTIGFIWQEFNLNEQQTVMENILLPTFLKKEQNYEKAKELINELKLDGLENIKVSMLSGGQKQRVAIIRELLKDPEIIIADEPTSALDQLQAKAIIEILRKIGKEKIVIIVTHDKKLFNENDYVYRLKNGELTVDRPNEVVQKKNNQLKIEKKNLSFKNSLKIVKSSIVSNYKNFVIMLLTIMCALIFIQPVISKEFVNKNNNVFDEVYNEETTTNILDLTLFSYMREAAQMGDTQGQNEEKVIDQDINGLGEKYKDDPRVNNVQYIQKFYDVKLENNNKTYNIESGQEMPFVRSLVAGEMPDNNKNEVLIPESVAKQMGFTPEEAIGKKIRFEATINTFENEKIDKITNSIEVTISGVIDTHVSYSEEYNGQTNNWEDTVDDSIILSKKALDEFIGSNQEKVDPIVVLEANSPEDVLSLRDELNKTGTVPLGDFERIENLLKLENDSATQAQLQTFIITMVVILMIIAISLISIKLRLKEFSILKLCGYSNRQIRRLIMLETTMIGIISLICALLVNILRGRALETLINIKMFGAFIMIIMGIILITSIIGEKTSILNGLNMGKKGKND